MDLVLTTRDFQQGWPTEAHKHFERFRRSEVSFVSNLMPEVLVNLEGTKVLQVLAERLGPEQLRSALAAEHTISSPVASRNNTDWLRSANIVGINVRTIDSFWNVVKYSLGLPALQDTIHLLPIWEPGVVSSLYGMASWHINPAFFSSELAVLFPELDTVEKQLKVVVNLLHALGKKVGMDVIPHTDRYAEIVLANPHLFEWLRRKELEIVDHSEDLHVQVMQVIFDLLHQIGSAMPEISVPSDWQYFFSPQFGEENRLKILFGKSTDLLGRNTRREIFVDYLFRQGLEPVPATMAPPYRSLEVDPNPKAVTIDDKGRVWRDYRITKPEEMSRVFGPLTRYKLYDRKEDNTAWEIDFDRPRAFVWDYVATQYKKVADQYHLDFMRGDMSHVQMRPPGVPLIADPYYDIHKHIKNTIQEDKPYFGYFGESFLTAPNYMGFGDEVEHLDLSEAEATLGDLQSMVVGSEVFLQNLNRYIQIHDTYSVTPSLTMMTADKDDPRFDQFYLSGNTVRFFMGFFITDMPSYMGLGFTCRDRHLFPAPNEHYTKLYVFEIKEGPKATKGPYHWGRNNQLFQKLNRIKLFAESIVKQIRNQTTYWLLPPDPTAGNKIIAWTQAAEPAFLFVCNLDTEQTRSNIKIPRVNQIPLSASAHLTFSSSERNPYLGQQLASSRLWLQLPMLGAGECQCYSISSQS
ncbi:MAG: hypothetical protein HRU41_03715 [Saprospiraceae bacterium]|nr:hypothetical protein [Saprospiraceae bacterium]